MDPKMIFAKKSGAHLIRAKGQTHPGSSEIGRSFREIQKITPKVCATKRELIGVSQVAYYLCGGVVHNFPFAVSQKNLISAL
jgi:hypothetical protein